MRQLRGQGKRGTTVYWGSIPPKLHGKTRASYKGGKWRIEK